MEEVLREAVGYVVVVVEGIGALIIAVGVLAAFVAYAMSELQIRLRSYEDVRLSLGRFLALGLEFQLGPTSSAPPSPRRGARSASSGPSRASGRC